MGSDDFGPGTRVRLVARPDVVGVVTGSRLFGGVVRYEVFHGAREHSYFASQIEPVPSKPSATTISAAALRAGLTSQMVREGNTAYLRSRNVGRIDYEPYQYRPVLKIVQADRPRILVADDVGVGKTIEACLIMKELQARQRAASVLIICPKPLVVDEKWRNELKRFDEDFVHLDGPTLRACLEETRREGAWPSRYARAIVPYSLLDKDLLAGTGEGRRRRVGLVDLAPDPQFDLVIVDEAHHIRNRSTYAYRNVRLLTESAEAVVMLTATPLQTHSQDLYTLVHLLRDDIVTSESDFQQMLAPNTFLHEAIVAARSGADGWQEAVSLALDGALRTPWGRQVMVSDARLDSVRGMLRADPGDTRARVAAVRGLEDLNTFSAIVTRTRRRDIGDFTIRKPSAPVVQFTTAQQQVYDAVLAAGRRLAALRAPGIPMNFILSMLRRQAASSISGLAPLAEELLANRLDAVELGEIGDVDGELILPDLAELRSEIGRIGGLAAQLIGEEDPKVEVLERIVAEKQTAENNKVLVFSTFRHTLRYLYEHAVGWGVRVAVVHGGVPDRERHALRRRFKLHKGDPDAIDLMLCSEVGTEGLDYQFCDTLVNYDIPWNPMRIEQRIGRIDRRGQKAQSVAIVNILTAGTVEADIYDRCLLRIGVFERALGGSEEILGDLTTKLRGIADDLTLTEQDRRRRLSQLADNEVGRLHELERLESQQGMLLGLTTESFEQRLAEASTAWLDEEKIIHLVRTYLEDVLPGRRLTNLKPGKVATIRLDKAAATRVSEDLAAAGGDPRLERVLHRGDVAIQVTTEADLAVDDPDIELLGPTHPLVRVAARHAALPEAAFASVTVRSDAVPPGRYPVAVHAWTRLDHRDEVSLRYVSTDPAVEAVADQLLALVTDGDPVVSVDDVEPDQLDQRLHDVWKQARDTHVTRARQSSQQRASVLRTQRDRRLRAIDDEARKAGDARIRRLHEGEKAGVAAKFQRLIAEHERAASSADIVTRQLVTVMLEVQP